MSIKRLIYALIDPAPRPRRTPRRAPGLARPWSRQPCRAAPRPPRPQVSGGLLKAGALRERSGIPRRLVSSLPQPHRRDSAPGRVQPPPHAGLGVRARHVTGASWLSPPTATRFTRAPGERTRGRVPDSAWERVRLCHLDAWPLACNFPGSRLTFFISKTGATPRRTSGGGGEY